MHESPQELYVEDEQEVSDALSALSILELHTRNHSGIRFQETCQFRMAGLPTFYPIDYINVNKHTAIVVGIVFLR